MLASDTLDAIALLDITDRNARPATTLYASSRALLDHIIEFTSEMSAAGVRTDASSLCPMLAHGRDAAPKDLFAEVHSKLVQWVDSQAAADPKLATSKQWHPRDNSFYTIPAQAQLTMRRMRLRPIEFTGDGSLLHAVCSSMGMDASSCLMLIGEFQDGACDTPEEVARLIRKTVVVVNVAGEVETFAYEDDEDNTREEVRKLISKTEIVIDVIGEVEKSEHDQKARHKMVDTLHVVESEPGVYVGCMSITQV